MEYMRYRKFLTVQTGNGFIMIRMERTGIDSRFVQNKLHSIKILSYSLFSFLLSDVYGFVSFELLHGIIWWWADFLCRNQTAQDYSIVQYQA